MGQRNGNKGTIFFKFLFFRRLSITYILKCLISSTFISPMVQFFCLFLIRCSHQIASYFKCSETNRGNCTNVLAPWLCPLGVYLQFCGLVFNEDYSSFFHPGMGNLIVWAGFITLFPRRATKPFLAHKIRLQPLLLNFYFGGMVYNSGFFYY